MIEKDIINLASSHAATLDNLQIAIMARPGTPLSTLVTEIGVAPAASSTSVEFNYVSDDFKVAFNAMADQVADHVRGYLDFTRNTVEPAILKLTDNVSDAIMKVQDDPYAGFDVDEDNLPRVFEDNDFMTRVQTAHALVQVRPNFIPRCDQRTGEALVEMLSTGFTKWDESFTEWFATKPEGTFSKVWNSLWVDPIKVQGEVIKPEGIFADPVLCVVAFLISTRMLNENMEDSQLSVEDQRRYNAWIAFESSKAIVNHVDRYNSFVTTNTLVDTIDSTSRKVKVNASVYKQYLAEGGQVDVLLGLLISEKSYRNVADIKAHAEELIGDWTRYTLAMAEYKESKFDGAIREIMVSEFEKLLDTNFGELEATKLAEVGVKQNMSRIFKEGIYNASRGQLAKDWQDVLWRITVQARYYYHSFVYEFLDNMAHNTRENGLDAASAAAIATQNIINNFIAEMIVKDDVKPSLV